MDFVDSLIEIERVSCYKCPKCEFVSLSRESVLSHLEVDHEVVGAIATNNPEFFADSSFHSYEDAGSFYDVEASNDDCTKANLIDKGFRCIVSSCNVSMQKESDLEYHRECHFESSYRCPECSEVSKSWKSMALHLWKNHSVDLELLSCHLCSYKTAKKELLKYHLKTHSDDRTYLCEECGKGFKNIKQLRNHKELHLADGTEKQLKNSCSECGKLLSSQRLLRAHMDAVHLKVRAHLCNYCGYNTTSQSNLRIHLRQHTKEKPFGCDQCDYRTGDHNSLRRHRMKHTGEKPYQCPYCPYASIQSSTFKVHLRNKHPDESDEHVFSCHSCHFRTVRKENLELHCISLHSANQ